MDLRLSRQPDPQIVDRLVALVDGDPRLFEYVVKLAKDTHFSELGPHSSGRWGTRAEFVFVAERMATRAESFESSEGLLRHLALSDPEPTFDNDAPNAWKRLFSITLSGTPLPFPLRFLKLRRIYEEGGASLRALVLDAATEALDFERARVRRQGDLSLISVSEPEWIPRDSDELHTSLQILVGFLADVIKNRDENAPAALAALVDQVGGLIDMGLASELEAILDPDRLHGMMRAQVVYVIDLVLRDPREIDSGQQTLLRRWSMALAGEDVEGLLLRLVGQWVPDPENPEHRRRLSSLANTFVESPSMLSQQLLWLGSDAAVNPTPLGEKMGRLDTRGGCLDLLLDAARISGRTSLVRGYVRGLIDTHPTQGERVNAALDALEHEAPEVALDIAIAGRSTLRAASRAIRLVQAGTLPATVLAAPGFWNRDEHVSDQQATTFVSLLEHTATRDPETSDPAMKLLWVWRRRPDGPALFRRKDFRASVWALLAIRSEVNARHDEPWAQLLGSMGHEDPSRAAVLAVRGLASESPTMARHAQQALVDLLDDDPRAVMDALGDVMLSKGNLHLPRQRKKKHLIAAIPDEVVIAWVEHHGVEAARGLARHLPAPHLHDETPVVPPVTAFVLEHFEHDDDVFEEFRLGAHGLRHETEATVARAFSSHPLRRIREWAAHEERSAIRSAERWRQYEAERASAHG